MTKVLQLKKSVLKDNETIEIGGSKSISNRLLILKYLFGNVIIENLSDAHDTELLQQALESSAETVDIHHAGTAMRFLTSYFSIQEGKTTVLTGSSRMLQRPIGPLVDALRSLGADIKYLEKDGFPPLKISGRAFSSNEVSIAASVSSQFISSLLLIAPALPNGLTLHLTGEITSRPYLEMTLKIVRKFGAETSWDGQTIHISPVLPATKSSQIMKVVAESDWSSASYFYSLAAIGRKSINLRYFRPYSLQGDSVIRELYWKFFGVNTISEDAESKISLLAEENVNFPALISLDMNDCPDIAQTLCVTATALQVPFHITGLATLKVKETDRLVALKNELFKIGCIAEITEDTIQSVKFFEPNEQISIETYQDHRMAMSFAPFSLVQPLEIQNPEVVEKSYPRFWSDLQQVLQED